jgi:hypothetical protein
MKTMITAILVVGGALLVRLASGDHTKDNTDCSFLLKRNFYFFILLLCHKIKISFK